MTTSDNTEPITQDDVTAFSQRLETWGKELPPKERALLQLVLAQAQGQQVSEIDVQGFALPSIGSATFGLLSPIAGNRLAVSGGWVEAGDPWVQRMR